MLNRSVVARSLPLLLLILLVPGLALAKSVEKRLQETLRSYASTFRWGEIEQVISYIDPQLLVEKPISSFELNRWRQWRVVGYRAQPYAMFGDKEAQQVVNIELNNVNTGVNRSIEDRQRWRYHKKTKRWLLVSGLPPLSGDDGY